MRSLLKRIIKPIVPKALLEARRRLQTRREVSDHDAIFHDKDPKEIFSEIYSRAMWGKVQADDAFCSGHGSHFPEHVDPYVSSVSEFLRSFPTPIRVVDLGCGDFNVGRQIRRYCSGYVACDIVPELIAHNKVRHQELNVDFRVVDIIRDPLPSGDVVIIRQVLQHLSNGHISQVIRKLDGFRFLILTEFIPDGDFIPNIDQPTGAFSRLARGINSGIVLTQEPFSLKVKDQRTICTTPEPGGMLKVIVYEL